MHAYTDRLWHWDARALDLDTEAETIFGETMYLSVSRHAILETTISELTQVEEIDLLDTRLPLDVTFRLEGESPSFRFQVVYLRHLVNTWTHLSTL